MEFLKDEGLWNSFLLLIVGYTVLLVAHLSFYSILKTYLNFWIEDVLFILVLTDCLIDENYVEKVLYSVTLRGVDCIYRGNI